MHASKQAGNTIVGMLILIRNIVASLQCTNYLYKLIYPLLSFNSCSTAGETKKYFIPLFKFQQPNGQFGRQ